MKQVMVTVSTGSGSDRVSIHATVEFAKTMTRSLSLPVRTSSLNSKCPDNNLWVDDVLLIDPNGN